MVKANLLDGALAEYLDERPIELQEADMPAPIDDIPVLKCPKCNSNMVIKTKRQGNGKYIGCMNYPTCNNVIWFPEGVEDVEIVDERCDRVRWFEKISLIFWRKRLILLLFWRFK